jgi:hypothetical protein
MKYVTESKNLCAYSKTDEQYTSSSVAMEENVQKAWAKIASITSSNFLSQLTTFICYFSYFIKKQSMKTHKYAHLVTYFNIFLMFIQFSDKKSKRVNNSLTL